MAKLNTATNRPAGGSTPIRTVTHQGQARTHEGAPGYTRDAKSELFLLAVGSFWGEDAFYEKANERNTRFARLVHVNALADPDWTVGFLTWLRGPEANIRTAALVGAAEFAKARIDAKVQEMTIEEMVQSREGQDPRGLNRRVIDAVCQRADEPAELLAYWTATYGRNVPQPVKRGLADAARRLYTERNMIKYNSDARGVRMADVVELVHPKARQEWQGELFKLLLDQRHGNDDGTLPESLTMLRARAELTERAKTDTSVLLDSAALEAAGLTWENALSMAGSKVDKAKLWEAMIPNMGIMAVLRNLRNFDEAGVSNTVAATVAARIADPDEVARSRQLPFRWLSAYSAVSSDRWKMALGQALDHSTRNIPELRGRTLVLVDNSGSMGQPLSAKSSVSMSMAAGLFGAALAARQGHGNVDLVAFAESSRKVQMPKGGSVLSHAETLTRTRVGMATMTADAIREHYAGHDRVMIFTDGQAWGWGRTGPGDVHRAVQGARLYTWDLSGHAVTHAPSGEGNSYEVGGLSDATFKLIPQIERGVSANWPWES